MKKIPFNLQDWLSDKSQKVVTRDGRPVEILKTNMPGELPLLVLYDGNDVERVSTDGKYQIDYDGMNDLFLVTEDEPELTEFEKTVSDLCWRVGMGEAVKDASQIKREADKLLSIARKQLKAEGWEISNYDDEDKPHHLNPPVSKWIDFPSEKQKEQERYEAIPIESTLEYKVGKHAGFLEGLNVGRKQKEQKPVEPSDDELQRHQDELYDFKVFATKQAKEHHIYFVHDFEWNNFCAELLSYFNEKQKPVEYLDKNKVYAIMNKLTNLSYSQLIPINSDEFKKLHEITSDVRSLLDYSIEQKSAEWSKEDEKMICNILNVLTPNLVYTIGSGTRTGTSTYKYDKEIAWLKSLRPSWKPSEEQMRIIQMVLTDEAMDDNVHNVLAKLYEQLKKLI